MQRITGEIGGVLRGLALALLGLLLGCSSGVPEALPPGAEGVLLLHGLARTDRSMDALAKHLSSAGFRVHNLPYQSRDYASEELTRRVGEEIDRCCLEAARLHIVAHSLGGLLARAYLAERRPANLGRVVMLAPPNQGSEIVDSLGDTAWFGWALGPTAQELGTQSGSFPNRLPAPDYEVGVIAGTLSVNPIGSAIIPDEDDGAVAVERTRLPGMTDFITVEASHTFIMASPEAAHQAIHFLRNGCFDHTTGNAP